MASLSQGGEDTSLVVVGYVAGQGGEDVSLPLWGPGGEVISLAI